MEFLTSLTLSFFAQGFLKFREEPPKYCLSLVREKGGKVQIVVFVENFYGNEVSGEQLEEYKERVINHYLIKNITDVEVFFLVLSDNMDRDRHIAESNINFWIVDMLVKRIIVFENQPDDYLGMKNLINAIFVEQDRLKKEAKIEAKRNFPFATVSLMIANALVFIIFSLIGSTGDLQFMLDHGAAYADYIINKGEVYRLVTCMFLHFGSLHLINNLISLIIVGSQLEKLIGTKWLFITYFLTGIGASIVSCFYYYFNNEQVISAGASGAIFGLIGAFAVVIFKTKPRGKFDFRYIIIIALIFYDNYATPGIDVVAHVMGFILGVVLAIALIPTKGRISFLGRKG